MHLTADLRRSLQDAYRRAYGTDIAGQDADILGVQLLETIWLILRINARHVHRSEAVAALDESEDKRDALVGS